MRGNYYRKKEKFKKFKKQPNLENWIDLKRNRTIVRKTIKKKKKENFISGSVV